MEIPYQQLSEEALKSIITDFVCRVDDFNAYSLDSKIKQVRTQLQNGSIIISFDEETESCFIQPRN